MRHLEATVAASGVIALAVAFGSLACAGCGDSKRKQEPAIDDQTSSRTEVTNYTCEQLADHIQPILKAFRRSDNSMFGKMAKNTDESPAAVKKYNAAVARTCEQRKHTQQELRCYMNTRTVADIGACATTWRERVKSEHSPAGKKPAGQ